MAPLQPVLLSGGSGTRLWPLSREAYPKQFLPLAGDDTMVQATWRRVEAIAGLAPIVVANEEHRFLVAEQLRQVGAPVPAILLEPVGRNTAPAIAAAALQAMAGGADPLLLVLPSDHVVRDDALFLDEKAVAGLKLYASHWPGRVRCASVRPRRVQWRRGQTAWQGQTCFRGLQRQCQGWYRRGQCRQAWGQSWARLLFKGCESCGSADWARKECR